MSTEHNQDDLKSLLESWSVDTSDVRARVGAAIGHSTVPESSSDALFQELRALREEISELRRSNMSLSEEMHRLRHELLGRTPFTRIAPFAPSEGLVRLS